jgi:hypothetical protein
LKEIKKIHLTGVVFSVIFITASASGLLEELWFKTRDKKHYCIALIRKKLSCGLTACTTKKIPFMCSQ